MEEKREHCEVRPVDVERQMVWLKGRFWKAEAGEIPRLQPGDIGKRCVLVSADLVQIENDEQRRARWVHTSQFPRGGDAVRVAAPWKWAGSMVKVGQIGIIGGSVEHDKTQDVHITFNYSAFNDGRSCSCSGGPATIATPIGELKPTGETVKVRCWMWNDGMAQAHNGRDYQREVRLWDWYPDTVTIPDPTPEEQRETLRKHLARCVQCGDVTDRGVIFDYDLCCSGGMFTLYRQPKHTDEDLAAAKDWLRGRRDVVSVSVTKIETNFPEKD